MKFSSFCVSLSFVAALGACRHTPVAAERPAEAEKIGEAGAPAPAVVSAEPPPPPAPACAPLANLAPYGPCESKVVKTPVPEILDETGQLGAFYMRLAELERARAERPVRIAIFGDSNLTSDFISAHLRRVLQTRYGDAGHGWVSLSHPWGSYRHEDVSNGGYWNMFKMWAPTTHVCPDKEYGFANMAAESTEVGATAWAGTAKDPKATVGKAVTSFELHYLKQPRGGSFRVEIDKKEVKTVDTKAPAFAAGIEELSVDEGPHELRAVVRGDGLVRLFGVSLDHAIAKSEPLHPGIQVDSLGAGALNWERMTTIWEKTDVRREELTKRAYDLVVFWLGMNVMFVPPNRGYATEVIKEMQASLPGVPILMLSPGDTAKEGETKSDPRIVAVIKQLREVAADTKVAFWDFREAMGGDGAIIGFTKRGLTGEDHIHFGPEGSRLMGDRLLCALGNSFGKYLADHPEAGCATSARSP